MIVQISFVLAEGMRWIQDTILLFVEQSFILNNNMQGEVFVSLYVFFFYCFTLVLRIVDFLWFH